MTLFLSRMDHLNNLGLVAEMQNIYLIRHGTTLHNEGRRYCGASDGQLSEKGLAQIEMLAKRLAAEEVGSVYSSPLSRALLTAEGVAKAHDTKPRPMDGLQEIDFGLWEGLTFKEIETTYPTEMHTWFDSPASFTFPEGESIPHFHKRVLTTLDRILLDQNDLAIVAHGGTLRVIICHLSGWGMDSLHSFELKNASITLLGRHEDSTVVKILNEQSHLSREGKGL